MTPPLAVERLLADTAWLRRLAFRLTADADQAGDLEQEVALAALRQPRADANRSWLAAVARNLAASMRRRRAAEQRRELAQPAREPARSAAELAAEAELQQRAVAAVLALPDVYRDTVLHRFLQQLSIEATAAAMGVPEETVRTRQKRALAMLRAQLLPSAEPRRRMFAWLTTVGVVMKGKLGIAAAAALLLSSLLVWQAWPQRSAAPAAADAGLEAVASAAPSPVAAPVAESPPQPLARSEVPAPPPAATRAALIPADAVVVQALDAQTGAPAENYALRLSTDKNFMAGEVAQQFAGEHTEGRLLLQGSDFGGNVWLLEDGVHLPSRWFSAADITVQDGVRTIEVRLPPVVEVALTVVDEHGGAPIAGSKVELVRAWPFTPEVTLRSSAVPVANFRGQVDMPPMAINLIGGKSLLLASGTTDADGVVHLRAPAGEPLALRLLGPGHRPVVRAPWTVDAGAATAARTEAVSRGGSVRGRLTPASALAQLRTQLPPPDPRRGMSANMLARYATGVRLVRVDGRESIPPSVAMLQSSLPIGDDGSFCIDGVGAGDWELLFCYSMQLQTEPMPPAVAAHPVMLRSNVEVMLASIDGLQEGELRVVDFDVSTLLPGRLEASVSIDGAPPDSGIVHAMNVPQGPAGGRDPRGRVVGHAWVGSPNFALDPQGRFVAQLPPGRYAISWHDQAASLPLPPFEIERGVTTKIDLAVDTTAVTLSVADADGSPARGRIQLRRAAAANDDWSAYLWSAWLELDATGTTTIARLPRDLQLRASLQPPPPAGGKPPEAIDLGTFGPLREGTGTISLTLPRR